VQKRTALYCNYLTYAKLTETQTLRTSFATVLTVQKADYFVIKVIEWPIPPLWCRCDVCRRNNFVYFKKKL